MGRHIQIVLGLLAVFAGPGAGPALADADLVVGVRDDAPPFSYLAAPRTEGRDTVDAESTINGKVFTGYMVNICTTVLAEMQKRDSFEVSFESIEAKDRFAKLRAGEIDILCDPATITQERLAFPNVFVSPPVYLSGVGRAQAGGDQWAAHWPCIGPVVGVVAGTTAVRSVKMIAKRFGFGETFSPIVSAHPEPDNVILTKSEKNDLTRCARAAESHGLDAATLAAYTAPDPTKTDPDAAYVVRSYESHAMLARALCRGDIYYSVGDLEIVARALDDIVKQELPDCSARVDPQVFSEERYGVFAHISEDMDRGDRLALMFLRQLSIEIHKGHRSVLVRSFTDNFNRQKISRSLDLFFWSVVAGAE